MARYLVTQYAEIIEETEAKSLREVAEGLAEGSYLIYTLQGEPKRATVESVTKTEVHFDGFDGATPEEE